MTAVSPAVQAHRRNLAARRRRMIAYGQWAPWVDASPVRAHVRSLMAAGMSVAAIAEASGISRATIANLVWGKAGQRRPPARRTRPCTAQTLLAVRVSLEAMNPRARVDAAGTRRRLRSLVAGGRSMPVIARLLGMDRRYLDLVAAGSKDQVHAGTALRVAELHRRIWLTPPVLSTADERRSATKARRHAERHGWASALAWDDGFGPHGIDNPDAVPYGTEQQGESAA